jgi:hypothetical protein
VVSLQLGDSVANSADGEMVNVGSRKALGIHELERPVELLEFLAQSQDLGFHSRLLSHEFLEQRYGLFLVCGGGSRARVRHLGGTF